MARGPKSGGVKVAEGASWRRWAAAASAARSRHELRGAMRQIGAEVRALVCDGSTLASVGIEVVMMKMNGRVGGIHDRWDRKVVVVDEDRPVDEQVRIVAHEVAHLLLGQVNRAGVLAMSREDQECLCDDFASWVLAAPPGAVRLLLGDSRPHSRAVGDG